MSSGVDRSIFHYNERPKKEIKTFDPKNLPAQGNAFAGSPLDAAESGFGIPAGGNLTTIDNH